MQRIQVTVDIADGVDPEKFVTGLQKLVTNSYGGSISVPVEPAVPAVYASFENVQFVGAETVADEPIAETAAVESADSAE